jgi:hypothetical protein
MNPCDHIGAVRLTECYFQLSYARRSVEDAYEAVVYRWSEVCITPSTLGAQQSQTYGCTSETSSFGRAGHRFGRVLWRIHLVTSRNVRDMCHAIHSTRLEGLPK